MSIGYCAYSRKILEDEKTIIYEYTCCNIGVGDWEKAKKTYDGCIVVEKDAFVEPTVHEKIKKMSSGRKKLVTKRIHNAVDYSKLIKEGKIKIENCSGAWKMIDGIDCMAWKLVRKMFDEYQDTGIISDKCLFAV